MEIKLQSTILGSEDNNNQIISNKKIALLHKSGAWLAQLEA